MKIKIEKSEVTKKYIIEKAAPIFNKYGYAGTSMSQLTKAIGMTKGAIYGNFKNKEEIALAAFDLNISIIFEKLKPVVAAEENANDKLIAYARFTLDNFPDLINNGGCPVLSAAVDSDFAHPVLRERVVEAINVWLGYITGTINDGLEKKQIKINIEPKKYASILGSLIQGGLMLSQVTGEIVYLNRNVEYIIHLVNTELRK